VAIYSEHRTFSRGRRWLHRAREVDRIDEKYSKPVRELLRS
jgi:hypothetical protein